MEIYRGKRLFIDKTIVTLSSGRITERLVVHPGDAVAVLPFLEDGRCCLIRQYRFAIGGYILEVPAGTIESGETPLETAHRELIEETGMAAGIFVPRGYIYTTPGFTDERIYLYEAYGLTPSHTHHPDEDEEIDVVSFPLHEVETMIVDNRICDAKTICLVYRHNQDRE